MMVDLIDIIRDAAINTAQRPEGKRGPFVFEEAELQKLAAILSALSPGPVAWADRPMEVSAMRELPRDLVTILRTEAKNQRTPPIDYVIAEDGGRMVHRPEPDIAMAELLEEAATALAAKDAELAAMKVKCQALDDECQQSMLDIARERDRAERAEAQLAEARKALEAVQEADVRVKPLEWEEVTAARSNEDPRREPTGDYEAVSPIGVYYIEQYFGSDSYGWRVTLHGSDDVADKDDPDDAKAAAQADYERRILSALSPASEMEPVAWRWTTWPHADIDGDEWPWTLTDQKSTIPSYATVEPLYALPPKTEGWASHLVEEGSTQSDEYTELALALTAAEARASSAEAQLAEMREALRKIVSCYDRNWQHQREKLDDIVPMARAALEQWQ